MEHNKSRRRGNDPSFPRLLGERLCLDFVNTVEGPLSAHPEEFLHDYSELVRWLRHASVLSNESCEELLKTGVHHPSEAARIYARALDLRDTLSRIFQAIAHDGTPAVDDLERLRAEYTAVLGHTHLTLDGDHVHLVWRADDGALARPVWDITSSALAVLAVDDLARVKQCRGADDCGWLFYDTSKNASRRWCSMEGCGSRVKMRQQYARSRFRSDRSEIV